MQYASSGVFRRALEDQFIAISLHSGVSLARLRKLAVHERFLARLITAQPGAWQLKGAFALQLRLPRSPYLLKNIDLQLVTPHGDVYTRLQQAAALDLNDCFGFEVLPAERQMPGAFGGTRYPLWCQLDGRVFENLHVDAGPANPLYTPVDSLATFPLLAFAGLGPLSLPCYPAVMQLAEKLHTLTRPREAGEHSRVKEFVDIVQLSAMVDSSAADLLQALQAVFSCAAAHPLPARVPPLAPGWAVDYGEMAAELGLKETRLARAHAQLQQFLDPVLAGQGGDLFWDSRRGLWAQPPA